MQSARDGWKNGWARRIVGWLVRIFYPRIEVGGADVPSSGPVLLCANHANSLIDPVVVGIAAGRPVRFLAKAPLFDVPVLGALMRALGMLPAYRGSDDARAVRRNVESLDAAAEVLQSGRAFGIFPEGKSHDAMHVEMVRSGAARIAIQAAENGAHGLRVIPVGINYEKKERFRSSIRIAVGEPIDVDEWLRRHDGESRPAMRAMTAELDRRLKAVVVHLDEPQWEPFLEDLEVLAPSRRQGASGKAGAVRQRKRIADAMNHFLATDRPRAEAVADEIQNYRTAVHAAGLRVDAPIFLWRGWRAVAILLWQRVWVMLFFLPALLGTLFHIVPFTVVRAGAAKLRAPGRTTISQSLLVVGLPVYLGWYAVAGWWMFGYFSTWFAATLLAVMPFLGLLALGYWRAAERALAWWWHQSRFLMQRGRLKQLRAQRAELQTKLAGFATEYDAVSPFPVSPAQRSWRTTARRIVGRTIVAATLLLAAWFAGHWFWDRPLIDPNGGVDLAAVPATTLEERFDSDEASLRAVLRGLDELERKAAALQADFAAGRRGYANEADNDAVRRLLVSYLNYRTVLIRMIWRYQRYAELEDEPRRLRAFLLGFASASALYDASSKFVHRFDRSAQTVARLNEGEPTWNIPAGTYDRIRVNLSSRANMRLLEAARRYYAAHRARIDALGLGTDSEVAAFHAAIRRGEAATERVDESAWRTETVMAADDLQKLAGAIRYETQSAISTWIGDFKIREPRAGDALIQPAQLAKLQEILQPGDILLERRNWYVSNAFLPGYWPHAALYVGTADDLKVLGLHEDPRVRPHWERFAAADPHGDPHVIIEAMSEGVVFSSLEHSIGGADSAAVVRPKLDSDEIREAIARAFEHARKPYDFEFDFTSRDKLVCTEVVYRAYGANRGPIHFPVREILGRRTMPAIELVRKVQEENGSDTAELEFIAFIDGEETTGTAKFRPDAAAFFQTLDRSAFTMLQGFETRPLEKIGPLGWALAILMTSFTVGNLVYYARRGTAVTKGSVGDEPAK